VYPKLDEEVLGEGRAVLEDHHRTNRGGFIYGILVLSFDFIHEDVLLHGELSPFGHLDM